MNDPIINADVRLPVIRFAVDIIRRMTKTYFKNDRFGATSDDLILCLSVFIGQVEGRAMNASKLSDYAGIPRPSVIRKLARLQQRGLMNCSEGAYTIPEHILNTDEAVASAGKIRRTLIETAAIVSKMNS